MEKKKDGWRDPSSLLRIQRKQLMLSCLNTIIKEVDRVPW